MGFLSFLHPRKEELALVLDIGNASVGGALVLLRNGNAPVVYYETRAMLPMKKNIGFPKFYQDMQGALEEVLTKLRKTGVLRVPKDIGNDSMPERSFGVLSSPWHISRIREITVSRPKTFTVSQKVFIPAIEREVRALAKEFSYNAEEEEGDAEISVVEQNIIQTRLNNYVVENPIGRKTRDVDMVLYVSVAEKAVLEMITEQVYNAFTLDDTRFSSYAFSFFDVARDVWSEKEEVLLVDISGETTEISLVENGVLQEIVSFPIGRNQFVRALWRKLKVSADEASSLVNLFALGKSNSSVSPHAAEVFLREKKRWVDAFQTALFGIKNRPVLKDILITADEPLGEWFAHILGGNELVDSGLAIRPPRVLSLRGEMFSEHIEYSASFKDDPFLAIDTLFANKVYGLS